jgi:hypothetical protein
LEIYLDYVLFMKELMREADIAARETGDTKIRGVHVHRNIGVPFCPYAFLIIENFEKVPGMMAFRLFCMYALGQTGIGRWRLFVNKYLDCSYPGNQCSKRHPHDINSTRRVCPE